MKNKFAIVLSGCGVFDGSEIHEATMTMYALSKNEIEYQCFAPDINQYHVINHITGEEMPETRNILIESARLARGDIKNLNTLKAIDFDGIIFPGGSGAAENLSDFAFEGENMKVEKETERIINEFHSAKKPIGALCIAPTIIAKVLRSKVTIGNDIETANAIIKMGGSHENKEATDISVDIKNKIITNPCYMLARSLYEIGEGVEAVVETMKGLI
jgi:enhancing lycopene biosynthesis protein 2